MGHKTFNECCLLPGRPDGSPTRELTDTLILFMTTSSQAQTSFFMSLLGIYFCLNKVDFLDQEALKDGDKTKTNVLLLTLQTAFSSNP